MWGGVAQASLLINDASTQLRLIYLIDDEMHFTAFRTCFVNESDIHEVFAICQVMNSCGLIGYRVIIIA